MSPEAQAALAALELLLKLAPTIYQSLHGGTSPAEVLAQARGVLPARGSARAKVDALFATVAAMHPRVSMHHADVLKRLAAGDSVTREERTALVESAAVVTDVVTAVAVQEADALSSPMGTWSEPSGENG